MADEKNTPTQEHSITEKLKAAAGHIDRHHADTKERANAQARASKEKAREETLRAREAEKRKADLEREATLNAAAEREAFEEERRQRKKLEREKRRRLEEERRALAEEKRARDEAKAREIAEAIERERAELESNKAKSAELLSKVNTTKEPDVEIEKAEQTESAPVIEEPIAEEPTAEEEPAVEEAASEEAVAEENVEEPTVDDTDEVEEPVAEPEIAGEATKSDLGVSMSGGEGSYVVTLGDGKKVGDFIVDIDGEEVPVAPIEDAEEEPAPTLKVVEEPAPAHKAEQASKPVEKVIPKVKSGKIQVTELDPRMDAEAPKPEAKKPDAKDKEKKAPDRIRLEKPNLAEPDLFDVIEVEPEAPVIDRIPIHIYDVDEDTGKVTVSKPKDESEEIPPLTFEDDLVTSIKKQGKNVNDKKSYKQYIKRSEKAINAFYSDINRIDKNIDNLEEENQIPPMVVDSVTIMGKIVDIRADNLSVTARTQKPKVTGKVKEALARDIDNYNSRVAYFAKVTGEQLTRLSAFLPDAIATGAGRPVIPVLKYTENYVEVFPDADGNLPEEEGNISALVIAPVVSFEEEIGNISPKNRDEAKDFIGRVNKSKKILLAKINDTAKAIEKNAKAKRKNFEKEEGAFTARDQDVVECFESFSRKERKSKKYIKAIEAIDNRYRSVITEAREERAEKRYDDVDKSLYVERLTAERERVVFTLEAIRSLRGIVTPKELHAIAASAIREMQTYNALAKECGDRIGKELSVVSGALADEVMRTGEEYRFPMIVKRRELCERIGKKKRIVGDKVKDDYLKTTKAERLKRIREKFNFDGDKSISDKALLREDIRLRAIERLAAGVRDRRTFKAFVRKCAFSFGEFKRSLKQTDVAIFRTRDKDGVIVAVTENLRVRGKYIASIATALECATDHKKKKYIKKYSALLEKQIERYNSRCADFRIITRSKANDRRGWKLTQISTFLPETIAEGSVSATVPELSYREHYVECYPMAKEGDNVYVDPAKRGCDYRPIDYKDRRYTENDMVEVTVINSPISAEESMRKDEKATGYRDARMTIWSQWGILYRVGGLNRYLLRARRHKKRALNQEKKFDKKLNKLIKSYERKTRTLNNKTPELLRESPGYVRKMRKLEAKYRKKSVKLRYKRVKLGIERRVVNYAVRELAIFREFVMVRALTLKRVRASAGKKAISDARRDLVETIREHNDLADELTLILGKPIARISTTVAEHIIREGTIFKFPKIALCRETIETVDNKCRAIGDKYRFGMPYTVNSQGVAVVTGTCRIAPGVGTKGIGLDADMRPLIGATNSGLHYAGTPNPGVLGIAVNSNSSTSVQSSGSNHPLFAIAEDAAEPKDTLFSDVDTKPVSAEIREINDYLVGAVSLRAGAVSSVFDYRHYTRRTRFIRRALIRVYKKNNKVFKKYDKRVHDVFETVIPLDNIRIIRQNIKKKSGNLTDKFRKKLEKIGTSRLLGNLKALGEKKQYGKDENVGAKEARRLKKQIKRANAKRDMCRQELRVARARVFRLFNEARASEYYRYLFELRTLAALGKLIEVRCADLCAASKLELTFGRQFKLQMLGLSSNPRKRCKKKLEKEIERYNDVHVARAEDIIGRENKTDLSLINTMLPEGLANREYLDDIPSLVYRDRYAEVVPFKLGKEAVKTARKVADEVNYLKRPVANKYGAMNVAIEGVYIKQTERSNKEGEDGLGEKAPEVNLINSSIIPMMPDIRRDKKFFRLESDFGKSLREIEKKRQEAKEEEKESKKRKVKLKLGDSELLGDEAVGLIKSLVRRGYNRMAARLDDIIEDKLQEAEKFGAQNETFTKKKLFALHRYEKKVFKYAKYTRNLPKYQRKMSRRLKRFRKRLYRLRLREIKFGIVKGRVKYAENVCRARIPNMSLAELRKKCAVEAMLLERRRLISAVYLCRAVHGNHPNDNEFKRKPSWLSKARRIVTASMIHYNTTMIECAKIIKTKKIWNADMSWYKLVQVGKFDEAIASIPKIVALRQLAEVYDEIKPIDQRSRTIVIESRE